MSNYANNTYNTTDLTLSVMARVANTVGLNINLNQVADVMYDICCRLEGWSDGQGFGSSDMYIYIQEAKRYCIKVGETITCTRDHDNFKRGDSYMINEMSETMLGLYDARNGTYNEVSRERLYLFTIS
jgi:hypothetical protein